MALPHLVPEQVRISSFMSAAVNAHSPCAINMALGKGDVGRDWRSAGTLGTDSAQSSMLARRTLIRRPDDSRLVLTRNLCSSASDATTEQGIHPSSVQASTPHGRAADDDASFGHDVEATSRELLACSELVQHMGPGFVYLGSSRIQEDHDFFLQSRDLSMQLAAAYGSTTWSGIGPGLMEAVCQGAASAGRKAAGFKVVMEATQGPAESYRHPHLPPDAYLVCRSLLARKQGLLWAGSRARRSDRAGFVALPGGVGTLDELLDLLAIRQLNMHGSRYPTPLLVLNYDGCYDALLSSLEAMEGWELLRPGELDPLWQVCSNNADAIAATSRFFDMHA